MRSAFITVLLFGFTISISCQGQIDNPGQRPLNSINVSFISDGFTVNYERLIAMSDHIFAAGKLGVGYNEEFSFCLYGNCKTVVGFATFSHHITINVGRKWHFFELGMGGTMFNGGQNVKGGSLAYALYPVAGWRFIPLESNKVNFRIFGLWPVVKIGHAFETENKPIIIPVGISVGISF